MAQQIVNIDKVGFENGSVVAPAPVVTVGNATMLTKRKKFSTGSIGWNITGSTVMVIDGQPVKVQISGNATICGTK